MTTAHGQRPRRASGRTLRRRLGPAPVWLTLQLQCSRCRRELGPPIRREVGAYGHPDPDRAASELGEPRRGQVPADLEPDPADPTRLGRLRWRCPCGADLPVRVDTLEALMADLHRAHRAGTLPDLTVRLAWPPRAGRRERYATG